MTERRFWERLRRNPGYIEAAQRFLARFPDYPRGEWSKSLQLDLDKFVLAWGFPPVDPSIETIEDEQIYYFPGSQAGSFVIQVYPWTTEEEVTERFRAIRAAFPGKALSGELVETAREIMRLYALHKGDREIALEVFSPSLPEPDRLKLETDLLFDKILRINADKGMDEDSALRSALFILNSREPFAGVLASSYQVGSFLSELETRVRTFLRAYLPS